MEELFEEENQVIAIVIIGVLLLLLMGVALLLFFFFSRKKLIEKELEKKSIELAHQKEITQSIIVTQEKERKRIAQDLHDEISSKLNIISLNANLLKDGELNKEEFLIANNSILETTDKTLESARKIAHNLLPPMLAKFGLKDTLEELADSFNNSKKITIKYHIKYPKEYLDKESELHLFRIVQELINNSIKHGKAKNSSIKISLKQRTLHFIYTDDGLGFNTDETYLKKGLGMKNIESRIALLKGKYTIESAKSKGFKITILL